MTHASQTLTLEQVQQACRFAYQLTGGDEVPIYNPNTGELAEIVPWEGVEGYGYSSGLSDQPGIVRTGPEWTADHTEKFSAYEADSAVGWYHLPGCDCEFCREEPA